MKWIVFILGLGCTSYAIISPPTAATVNGTTLTSSYQLVCDAVSGSCLSGITNGGKYIQHLLSQNDTGQPISFAMTTGNNLTPPAATTTQKFIVASGSGSAWDDVAIFNNLFIRTEGTTPPSGNVTVHVW